MNRFLVTVIVASFAFPIFRGPATDAAENAGETRNDSPQRERVLLKNGSSLCGEILKTRADAIVVDLGFTVLTVPVEEIRKRLPVGEDATDTAEKPLEAGQLYAEADPKSLKERPVKDLVETLGESVALVSTPGGMGSGFVVDPRGYVVTNFHVIEREQEISVTIVRKVDKVLHKEKIDEVKIVAINPYVDLALLKLDVPKNIKLKRVYLGSRGSAKDGESVFAIGNPLGLERTISEGIVSSRRRNFQGQLFVQTTAPLNPGNSGGPLFNLRGEVIGVTNMKAGWFTEGLSFAVPVDTLKFFLRNRDVFAYDKDNPNTGYHYLPPPRKSDSKKEKPEDKAGEANQGKGTLP